MTPTIIEKNGQRVIATTQLAEAYETDAKTISYNFNHNRKRYIEGKHYIVLTGDELRDFKHEASNCRLVDQHVNRLYLWTERGALMHAKSLNTDKAWEVYDYLVEHYFRAQEQAEREPVYDTLTDEEIRQSIQRKIREMKMQRVKQLAVEAREKQADAELAQMALLSYLRSEQRDLDIKELIAAGYLQ